MRRWPYECCNWFFVVCVLPLSYLVTFSNHSFQFVTELETSKNKMLKVFILFVFFFSGEESLFWEYLFNLPEKYYLPSPDKQGGNDNCMWILTGA